MKKLYLVALLFTVLWSCKKDMGTPEGTLPDDTTFNLTLKEVGVTVPSGVTLNLEGSSVFSYGMEKAVDGSGKSSIAFEQGKFVLAWLVDKNGQPLMAGLITDSTSEISPASTAKALLYLAYNIPLQIDSLSPYFINNISLLAGAKEWENQFVGMFRADPLVLSKQTYIPALRTKLEEMVGVFDPADIRAQSKAADILVDANDIRSGLQVSEEGLSQFQVSNQRRRRAHAFLYKMYYRDLDDKYHVVTPSVDKSSKSDKDYPVGPVAAINGFLSEVGKNIEGKGIESAVVTSGPFKLELQDKESMALYKLRIIGPGRLPNGDQQLTEAEESMLTRLRIETFLLDFVVPAISIVTSAPDIPKGGNLLPKPSFPERVDALAALLKTLPDVTEEIKNGNYKVALEKFMLNVMNEAYGVKLDMVLNIATMAATEGSVKAHFVKRIEHLLFILKAADATLAVGDLLRIDAHLSSSRTLEEWEIKARAGQVKLLPKESAINTRTKHIIKAEVKNVDENGTTHPFFEWSTSGKYGTISDTKGHSGTSFASADAEVTYYGTVAASALSEGPNLEYIYVTAKIGNAVIGRDTAVIDLKKTRYQMKPDGATLTGKKGGHNSVALYLEKTDGTTDIKPNDDTDYKVVWSTPGKHGTLLNVDGERGKTLTDYDNDQIWYECTDKDTKEGTESIQIRVYSKPKGEPASAFSLFEEVKGTVKINNDPKKKVIKVQMELFHGDTTTGPFRSWPSGSTYYSYQCHKSSGVRFKEDPEAASYFLRFFVAGKPTIGAPTTQSWKAGDPSPYAPASFAMPGYAGGFYAVIYSYGARVGPTDGHANGSGRAGYAEVIITLK